MGKMILIYQKDQIQQKQKLIKTYCVIGFLSKHNYKYIFEKTDALKKNDILSFLKSLKILQEVNNEVVINNIYNAIKERRIYRGEYLIIQINFLL